MTNETKLLPCPFCGTQPDSFLSPAQDYDMWMVSCANNDCKTDCASYRTTDIGKGEELKEEVEKIWNHRTPDINKELLGALKLVKEEKAPAYHDCLDDGLPECAWCIMFRAIANADKLIGGDND